MASYSFHEPVHISPLLPLLKKPRNLSQILQIHAQSITSSLFAQPFFSSRLLFALSQLAKPPTSNAAASYAELIFFRFPNPSSFMWNTIIKIQSQSSNPNRSLHFFIQMRRNGADADEYTYPFVLNACSSLPGLREGAAIHGDLLKRGCGTDLYASNCLITFYCRNAEIASARKVFDGFRLKDSVSWNSMIAGYAGSGHMAEAQKLFDEMPQRDRFSWAILIDGYGKKTGDVERARQLFDVMPEKDAVVWNSMIDSYAGAGNMAKARELFTMMPMRNMISWSVLIDGYVRYGDPKEALDLFRETLRRGMEPDRVAAVGAIAACAQLGALDQGVWVHSYLKKKKISLDIVAVTALIDMYTKCGCLEAARRLFENMHGRTVVSWNVMIVGLGINGRHTEAVELFDRMELEGASLDELTFLGALTACAHGGLISDATRIFDKMQNKFKIEPKVEHYGCLVDLFGRAGRLREALGIIESMPMDPTPTLWGSFLAACRTHRCVELAELSVRRLSGIRGDDCGAYVQMSNIYAENLMWDEVGRVRRLMKEREMGKEIGGSVVEVGGSMHEFVNGDRSHALRERIYEVVLSLTLALDSDCRVSLRC